MASVAVIDYGMGNLHSISKALEHVAQGSEIIITSNPDKIIQADRIVFPGVGAIKDCMLALEEQSLIEVLKKTAEDRPFLGICLGMQALLEESDEGNSVSCLGLIPGKVVHFERGLVSPEGEKLKIPHMGWNNVHQTIQHPLWKGIPQEARFYFVHSYYAVPECAENSAATADYPEPFSCALSHKNIFAVQFHPEKSQTAGLQLLENFLGWNGAIPNN
ncbi:MAG: imidazole glycerol phosphate synthase subunit HisH [Gammaproteobacteria bacterium]|nr:MAG: imidazole glycerol phosphate synthase subunit HisH [Gammaproteobacteria bacterium]RLA23827.1 MAG: imidazole glycerol phosphate synthase subunit HisH [Gammaproteobacteria bacterium]